MSVKRGLNPGMELWPMTASSNPYFDAECPAAHFSAQQNGFPLPAVQAPEGWVS